MAATSDKSAPTSPKRPPVQQADEPLLAFLDRLTKYSETTATELRKWEEEEVARQQEIQRQLAEAEAARQQAAAEAAAAARLQQQQVEADQNQARYQATMDLTHDEATYGRLLRRQHFHETEERQEPTTKEADKEGIAVLMENLLAAVDCSPALTARAKQLEERVNHLVASLGDISKFAGASTVSNQLQTLSDRVDQRPVAVAKEWKMPNFKIEKFDDYHKTDPLQWWMAFNAEADVHHTPPLRRLDALYLQLIGGAQAFMTHMAATLECTIATLHTKITWEEFEKKWKTRFMVNNDKRHALNKIFHIFQGQQPSWEWLTEWQRLVATPELNLPFDSIRGEFFARSCDALTAALGSEYEYKNFDDMIAKARELIQGNRRAANETRQQPGYVEKGKGQRTPQVAIVQQGQSEDHAAASTSSDGDVAAAIPPQRSKPRGGKQKAKPASADGARQAPWTKFGITEDMFKLRQKWGCCLWFNSTKHITSACLDKDKENVKRPGSTTLPSPPESAALLAASLTSGDTATVASSRVEYENYAVELVPPLNQPLHVQDSSVCAAVPPSDNEPVASPAILSKDPSTWARLEDLDPLTVEDFQWLHLPSTGSLPTPHCNALMAHLHEYLHAAIDRDYATQRYVDSDAPLLYIRIQIGKATCSALIDCGATRNYISQDFMARAGLGPRVRRKSQPTHVTLADGHTQKSIDRCVDSVPVYFAPLASEAVSLDILDTKFDMILGMLWLQSEDHPVNFHRRTVHIRDRHGELVPCTVPLPHPSIGCHVVSAASIRQSIRLNDIEEMGICFLHALPPGDQPKTDTSDPRIIELLDSYGDVFQAPAGVIPDRTIRHAITLKDDTVPPRGCIYRMSEKEHQVLRAQLDDLLANGWIRPSCSPYGAPVLFVRKKNKDLRLCIDYRKLNAQTIKNAGPLPRIDDLLERLGGAKYFSKLDLKSEYHQIEIQPRDRYKTAFKTRYGHFEWIVMPFGLTNAPATFQAAMTTKFRDLLDCSVLIYLDDILVYSRSLDEHLKHLRAVLERLCIAKYKANRDKCEFAQQELEYLGHYVTPQGIRPLANKLQAIQDWSDLKCTTDVRSFLGLASYYMRFVKGFQRIAAPLSRLQSPLVPFEFSDEARHAFHTLKTALLQAPILSIYDPTLPTKVTTDASGNGIGAVLEQHDGTDWHPVEYFSQKVPPINTLDDARKKELLAFVSVLERWRHFLLGRRRFTWATDNNPLTLQDARHDAACSPASTRKYRELLAKARANVQKAQVRMQRQANRRRISCPIRVGDLVWVTSEEFALEQDVSRKLLPKWFGPWMVTSAAGNDPAGPSLIIEIPPHLTVHPIFHASKLAVYTPASAADFPGRRSQDPPSMDGHQEVDRVLTHRKHGNKPMQYKVTFKQCDPNDTRWISRADMKASAPLVFAHYEKQRLAKEAAQPARPVRTSDRQLRPRS
ncbi:hypothetical protein CBR_g19362 [Chara braunii]|uniref:Reverse transcriptase domain-containing protein n=1 Tax=Chara braunii TaxID=69332 RepID=A0A388KXQ8_CHABU|nr:hypothetical protein CBR_g19362 [Chara braunii]|eukprot:GBG74849.1 hypothetical protein CBR_g19362 [Chara braunii]